MRSGEAGLAVGLQEAGSGQLRTCSREAGSGDWREPRRHASFRRVTLLEIMLNI